MCSPPHMKSAPKWHSKWQLSCRSALNESHNAHTHCVPTVVTHRLLPAAKRTVFCFSSFLISLMPCCFFYIFWMLLHLLLLLNFNTSSHTLNSATVKAKIVVYFLFSVSVFKYFRCRGRAGAKLAEPSEKRWSRQCEAEGRVACLVALTGSIINQLLWARKLAKWKLNTQMCGACDCEYEYEYQYE